MYKSKNALSSSLELLLLILSILLRLRGSQVFIAHLKESLTGLTGCTKTRMRSRAVWNCFPVDSVNPVDYLEIYET